MIAPRFGSGSLFRPRLCELESRLVPESSGFTPGFFENLQFDTQQRQEDIVRVYQGQYQELVEGLNNEVAGIDQGQEDVVEQFNQGTSDLAQQKNDFLEQAKAQLAEYERRGSESLNELIRQTREYIANLESNGATAVESGSPADAVGAFVGRERERVLSWSAEQYANITAATRHQMQEVVTAYMWLDAETQRQHAALFQDALARYQQLEQLQSTVSQAYQDYNVILLNEALRQLEAEQLQLEFLLSAYQAMIANESQLVTTQQLQQSAPSGGGGGGGGGQSVFHDDNAPGKPGSR